MKSVIVFTSILSFALLFASTSFAQDVRRMQDQLNEVDRRLERNETKAQNNEIRSNNNAGKIEDDRVKINSIEESLQLKQESIELNTDDIVELKDSLTGVLDQVEVLRSDLAASNNTIESISNFSGLNKQHINRFWMLLAAMLVFFMQAGFKVFEVGLVRDIDADSVGIKNLSDWMVVAFIFLVVGFAFMFGRSDTGIIGTSLFGLRGMDSVENEFGFEFFLFQLAFAATAATIVSGALAVRIHLLSYLVLALFIGGFIYPIFGHWVWGHYFIEGQLPLLARFGFLDFAGSTVVHSVGAWIALTGMWFIRPRSGKHKNGNRVVVVDPEKFKPHNLGYSVLGVLILWFGWWGFNGGSTEFITANETSNYTNTLVPEILINTSIAAVFGGLAAFLHCYFMQGKKLLYEKLLGGTLGGLVAITACCNVVSLSVACGVGLVAGIIHNLVYDRLNEKTVFGKIIDDPVGAIPVHGACGIWGTFCVVFGKREKLINALGDAYSSDWTYAHQVFIQLGGIAVCAVFTILASILVFSLLKNTIGIEIPRDWEEKGWVYEKEEELV